MTNNYQILPLQFKQLNDENYLIVNECGDFYFLNGNDFELFVTNKMPSDNKAYDDLQSRHFLAEQNLATPINLIATKYRSRKRFLNDFTSLHMMVITLRCNHKCKYCQVSSADEDASKFDMSIETAKRITDYIFQTPSKDIKIEFQGGEPLLNWSTIVETILYAKQLNSSYKKHLEFVICTNLIAITNEQLLFLKEHDVYLSTSLDGPKLLHNKNRILRSENGSYDIFLEKLNLAKTILGHDKISALMTTTIDNIDHFKEVIDEYVSHGFNGIFFRSLNPYGDADKNKEGLSYPIEKFLKAYEEGLNYILKLNESGTFLVDYYSTLLLTRILTPFSTGFVDLQSPSGAGISGVIYDYNGDVYPADEARMLARMGDTKFKMGNVYEHDYKAIFTSKVLMEIVSKSCIELLPGCATCVYQAYCGTDPIRNYLETGDVIGYRPNSDFCKKHMGLFDMLFKKLLHNKDSEMDIFWSWITRRPLKEVRIEND